MNSDLWSVISNPKISHPLLTFPNGKINLGLRILDLRADGFHNIETIFYPVQWCDVLEILPSKEFYFETAGTTIDANAADNVCVKAFQLLQKEFSISPTKIFLLKNIPVGSGLGGGSSDAAFTLRMLNEIFDLKLSAGELQHFAAQLGSDCPFFIENKPCFAKGKGEQLVPVDLDLSKYFIVVVYPDSAINTVWAYKEFAIIEKSKSIRRKWFVENLIPIEEWKEYLINDFEEVVFKKFPEIEAIKNQLYKEGALFASLSGSGSAVYGIFRDERKLKFNNHFRVFRGKL